MKKRIAFFINSLARGGSERVLSRIIPRLKEDYEIYLILIDGSRIEYECSVEIIKMGGKEKKNRVLYLVDQINAKKKLERIVRNNDIECVISFITMPNLINVMAKTKCKKIISIRTAMIYELKNGGVFSAMKYCMCKRKFRNADAVICTTSNMRKEMVKNWHIDNESAFTIENPYDVTEISLLAEQKMNEREIDFYATHRVIVAVGRLTKVKGFLYLLDSFFHLLSYQKTVGLVIVGSGEQKEILENKIKKLGIQRNVMLCGVKKNPYPYIKNASVFVLSSINEGFPNVLVEAMCCGTPVVACDCQYGPREILSNQKQSFDLMASEVECAEYGILVPDFTRRNHIDLEIKTKMLARAVNLLLENEQLRQKYAQKAAERAEFYTLERCIEKYKEVIN